MSQNKLSAIIIFLIGEHQSPKGNEFLYTKEKKKKKKKERKHSIPKENITLIFFKNNQINYPLQSRQDSKHFKTLVFLFQARLLDFRGKTRT